jgi:hypothetical protein
MTALQKWLVYAATLCICLALSTLHGCGRNPCYAWVEIVDLDFTPKVGDWNLNWPGPPRRALKWSDTKQYDPTLKVNKKVFSVLTVEVREDRSFASDPKLGEMKVYLNDQSYEATDFRTDNKSGEAKTPDGAPDSSQDFWLGCTSKGEVRGSHGKGDDRHARVYLVAKRLVEDNRYCFQRKESPRHTVRCN